MKSSIKLTPIAVAMAAVLSSPLAMANPFFFDDDVKINHRVDTSSSDSQYKNKTNVEVERTSDRDFDVDVKGGVYVYGKARVEGTSGATTIQNQTNYLNSNVGSTGNNGISSVGGSSVGDSMVDNKAKAVDNGLRDASGNIGLNITAGDNNAQDNSVALSKTDAAFVFASADSISNQNAERNTYVNTGNRNTAVLGGNTLRDATGNIAVNIAAGQSNLQANSLAASVNTSGTIAEATVSSNQVQDHNFTSNQGMVQKLYDTVHVRLDGRLKGEYEGTSDQYGDVYLDNWSGALPHASGSSTGHTDVDNQVQAQLPDGTPVNTDPNGDGGSFLFNEQGDIKLGGTFSGHVVTAQWIVRPHENNASLSGDALRGASGNIGVNIASGTNNLQGNHLAIAAAMGTPTTGGGE